MATDTSERELPFWLRPPAILLFVAVMVAVRFIVAAQSGLVRDESYYTFWSFVPAAGYLDHPPMVAWMIGMGRALIGESEAGARLFPVLATAVISFAIYRTGRLLFDARTAGIAVIWYNLTVAAGLLFLAVPDAPSVTFWTMTGWAVAEFVARRNANWWLAAGLFAGLGLLSKYTTLFLGLGLVLYLVTSRERLGWLRLWQVWAGGALALAVFLPNIVWNAERGWASFAFQGRRLGDYGINFGSMLDNLGDLLAGQALATGVFLFLFVLAGIVVFFLRRDVPGRANLALPIFLSLPILLYFIAYTARFRVEANWPTPVWPLLSLVGAWAAVHLRPANAILGLLPGIGRWAQAPVGAVILGLIYAQTLWQPFALGQAIDRTRDMRGWDLMQAEVAQFAEANGAQWIATGGGDYGVTGALAAYGRFAGSALPVRQLDDPERWDFLPPLDPALLEAPALFVHSGSANVDFPKRYFGEAELVGEARRTQGANDEELERFAVYRVNGLLPGARNLLEDR
jgi:4-amino-4-deoxy-L-arabinose transferase-like glycosyltransferase